MMTTAGTTRTATTTETAVPAAATSTTAATIILKCILSQQANTELSLQAVHFIVQ
jgi:hypothetical protein